MKSYRHFFKTLVVFSMILLMSVSLGCSKKVPMIKFKVKSKKSANQGQPVYLMIRSINGPEFVTDDYDTIARLFNATPMDESIIASEFIIPGNTKKFKVKKPDDKHLGVYCMFTKPEAQWKILLQKPLGKKYTLYLIENDMQLD